MTKAEMLSEIEKKYDFASEPIDITDSLQAGAGLKFYRVYVWDKNGDVMNSTEVYFFTEGEKDTDQAWWRAAEPKKDMSQTFASKAYVYLDAKVTSGDIKSYVVDRMDRDHARVLVCTGTAEKTGYVRLNSSGDVEHLLV